MGETFVVKDADRGMQTLILTNEGKPLRGLYGVIQSGATRCGFPRFCSTSILPACATGKGVILYSHADRRAGVTDIIERRRAFRIDAGLHGIAYLDENRSDEHACFISNLSEFGCRIAVEQGGGEVWLPGKAATVEIDAGDNILQLPGLILAPVELIETWGVSMGVEFVNFKRDLKQKLMEFMHSDHEQLSQKSVRLYAREVKKRYSRRKLLKISLVLTAVGFALLLWRIMQTS
jgi:hypothetical protein